MGEVPLLGSGAAGLGSWVLPEVLEVLSEPRALSGLSVGLRHTHGLLVSGHEEWVPPGGRFLLPGRERA